MSRFETMKPRQVEAYLREKVREFFGNEIEDSAKITSRHGFYTVEIDHEGAAYSFGNFRKRNTTRIVRAMKFLAGK